MKESDAIWFASTVVLSVVAVALFFASPDPKPAPLSSTLYLPRIVHVPVDSCKTMFPPAEVGPLCEFYDGINLPDDCAAGYHLETEHGFPDVGALGVRVSATRKVCHLDSDRGERGLGLDCANPKGTP